MTGATGSANFPFRGAAVAQQIERCLNARHRAAGCRHCVTLCPVAALTLVDDKPVLAAEQCVKCGLCLHGCPTEVFTQPNAAERQLLRTVEQLPRQPIVLVCALHPTPQHTTAPVTTIVQHRRCLAALSLAQLLTLSEDGERAVWLDDTPCCACPIGQAQSHLQQTVATANTLLQAFGRPAAFLLQSSQADQPTTEAANPRFIDSGNPPVSRRGLFTALGRAIHTHDHSTLPTPASAADNQPIPVPARLPQQIPAERMALQERLQQQWTPSEQGEINVTALPFAAIQLNAANCSACGLCARFCPTGALHFTVEEAHFRLSFQAALCLDCPVCTLACPEKAIRLGDTLSTDALLTNAWLPLLEGRLTPCGQCGVPTADQPKDQRLARCHSCRQGAGAVQSLRDGAGLMADLLTRSAKIEKNGI